MESVRPLPFELSLLMCFMSPLQFHIPEQLSCSKKLEIQRDLVLLFHPVTHQLRLTITRLEKHPWVQPLVCRYSPVLPLCSETSRGVWFQCPLSVLWPCPRSSGGRFGSTSAPGCLWQSPPCRGAGERDGLGAPLPSGVQEEKWVRSLCPRCRKEDEVRIPSPWQDAGDRNGLGAPLC